MDDSCTGVGVGALNPNETGLHNSAFGKNALRDVTSGNTNTAIGSSAMVFSQTSERTTAVGHNAAALGLEVKHATAVGYYALHHVGGPGAWYNTAVGYQAGIGAPGMCGASNTVIGAKTFRYATTATQNTLLGAFAGEKITTGAGNIGLGFSALWNLQTGHYNIAIGHQAGQDIQGSYNVVIGSRLPPLDPAMSRNVILANGYGEIRAHHDTKRWKLGAVRLTDAPVAPEDGDLWATEEGLFLHLAGVTRKVALEQS